MNSELTQNILFLLALIGSFIVYFAIGCFFNPIRKDMHEAKEHSAWPFAIIEIFCICESARHGLFNAYLCDKWNWVNKLVSLSYYKWIILGLMCLALIIFIVRRAGSMFFYEIGMEFALLILDPICLLTLGAKNRLDTAATKYVYSGPGIKSYTQAGVPLEVQVRVPSSGGPVSGSPYSSPSSSSSGNSGSEEYVNPWSTDYSDGTDYSQNQSSGFNDVPDYYTHKENFSSNPGGYATAEYNGQTIYYNPDEGAPMMSGSTSNESYYGEGESPF